MDQGRTIYSPWKITRDPVGTKEVKKGPHNKSLSPRFNRGISDSAPWMQQLNPYMNRLRAIQVAIVILKCRWLQSLIRSGFEIKKRVGPVYAFFSCKVHNTFTQARCKAAEGRLNQLTKNTSSTVLTRVYVASNSPGCKTYLVTFCITRARSGCLVSFMSRIFSLVTVPKVGS